LTLLDDALRVALNEMRKRHERKRGKHSPEDPIVDSEVDESSEGELEAPQPADVLAPVEPDAEPSESELPQAEQVEETPPVEAILSGASPESSRTTTSEPAGKGTPELARPDSDAIATPHPSPAQDLDALGRMLEQSLGGSSKSPPPQVSVGEFVLDPGTAGRPPEINATPEDILGVPTQHGAIQEMNAATVEQQETEARSAQNLGGTGTGAAPMEAFEQRAQMAKEVLRASSNQTSPSGARASRPVDQDPSDPEEPAISEEVEQDVRFSEDLTISVKRRRRLFGR
jgi:hypothetical protein